MPPNTSGIVPLSLLVSILKYFIDVALIKDEGTFPYTAVDEIMNVSRESIAPNISGNVPLSLKFTSICRYTRLTSEAQDVGTVPLKLFSFRRKFVRAVQLLREDGILPESVLKLRTSVARLGKFANTSGTVPTRL